MLIFLFENEHEHIVSMIHLTPCQSHISITFSYSYIILIIVDSRHPEIQLGALVLPQSPFSLNRGQVKHKLALLTLSPLLSEYGNFVRNSVLGWKHQHFHIRT